MAKFNFKKVALLFAFLTVGLFASAQSIKDIKINEVLVENDGMLLNAHGRYASWIEIHNTGYSSINIGGCFVSLKTIDLENSNYEVEDGVTYKIPTNASNLTTIGPGGFLVLYADGHSGAGPLYANFSLENATEVTITDASGKVFIDKMDIDRSMVEKNVSIGRPVMTYKEILNMEAEGKSLEMVKYEIPTPAAVNMEVVKISSSDEMMIKDPKGGGMAMISMGVVFSALLLLFIIFKNIGIANQKFEKRKEISTKSPAAAATAPAKKQKELEASAEVLAAITFALKQYRVDVENMESNILTINKTARSYSPWSSKIYSLTQQPNRK